MKKILFLMTLLAIGISQAQNTKRDRSPEQVASIQSKKMTLALDLDATQQARVEQLLLVNAKERQTHKMNKKDRVQLNDLEKLTRMETMLDKRIVVKREMKSILNADQYKSWEKMMAKTAKIIGEKNRRGERRNPRQSVY
jgi:protein CpxP